MNPVYFYYPNLIGYFRIASLALAVSYALTSPWHAFLLYALSMGLDGIDGEVARYFNQCSTFGAQLDMLCDRMTTTTLYLSILAVYSQSYPTLIDAADLNDNRLNKLQRNPNYQAHSDLALLQPFNNHNNSDDDSGLLYLCSDVRILYFCISMIVLDITSHWLQVTSNLNAGNKTHKECTNPFLKLYYSKSDRRFMLALCFGQEFYLSLLYLKPWLDSGKLSDNDSYLSALIYHPLIYYPGLLLYTLKQLANLFQLFEAADYYAQIDWENAGKSNPTQ